MARKTMIGIQLPPDSTGKKTGGFKTIVQDDTGTDQDVYVPATFISNANGEEIGGQLLEQLTRVGDFLELMLMEMKETNARLGGN